MASRRGGPPSSAHGGPSTVGSGGGGSSSSGSGGSAAAGPLKIVVESSKQGNECTSHHIGMEVLYQSVVCL
jgi:hypothetical protein